MCAISGIITDDSYNKKINIIDAVEKMVSVMNHRGPDDRGKCEVYSFKNKKRGREGDGNNRYSLDSLSDDNDVIGCLGFNRLSIRDLSMNGHQPMLDEENKVAIVFNGEIYNSEDLKREYLDFENFKSSTDTEVILKLYKKLGIDKMVELLDGMFAFCILDIIANKVYIARDRVGIKPLYLYHENGILAFASEMKAILAAELFRPQIDLNGFFENMMFSFSYKNTLITGIQWFEPGTYGVAELSDLSKFVVFRYWRPEDYVHSEKLSYKASLEKMKKILSDSVKTQMVSDVFVGCQLSGGVDSSLITNYFAENRAYVANKDKIQNISFGIIPEDVELSEEPYMETVSKKTGITVKKIKVENNWVYKQWKDAIYYLDGIPSFTNEMGIKALALGAKKSGVTVLMSGEGADEVFGGYSHITDGRNILTQYKLRKLIGIEKKYLKNKNIYESAFTGDLTEQYYLLYSSDGNFNDYLKHICPNMENYREVACKERKEVIDRICAKEGATLFDKSRCYDLAVRVGALCNRQDKMTMAASIENRVPFLANDVIEQGLSIPESYLSKTMLKPKPRCGRNPFMKQGKFILKDICRLIYGDKFAFRYKQGFPLPLEDYIREFIYSAEFEETMDKLKSRNLVNMKEVRKYCEEIKNHKGYFSGEARMLWRLFSIEFFCEQFIDPYNA